MSETHPNLLIITWDSLRYDSACWAKTPHLDKDLGRPILAHANAMWTWPAHWALFAGWYPDAFGAIPEADRYKKKLFPRPGWSDGYNTSIEVLRTMGYSIAGTASCNPLRAPAIQDLFTHYRFEEHASLEVQIDWLKTIREKMKPPWFVFVNACETHYPYGLDWEKLGALEQLRHPDYRQKAKRMGNVHSINGPGYPLPGTSKEADQLYDEFRKAQPRGLEKIDELWPALREALPHGSFTAMTMGDHGECFGEDGCFGHGFGHSAIYQVPMRVAHVE